MAYNLSKASNVMKIAEQEHGTAKEIKFTTFTSCVGIMARKGSSIAAVHLVLLGDGDAPFDDQAVTKVLEQIDSKPDEIFVIGNVNIWKADGRVKAAFNKLIAELDKRKTVSEYNFADGTYGGKIDEDGDLEITY